MKFSKTDLAACVLVACGVAVCPGRLATPPTPSAAVQGGRRLQGRPETMKGFRTWRAAACDRCHGANQEGLVGPSLINSLKTLSQGRLRQDRDQRPAREGHAELRQQPEVMENIDQLYAYLKGRSDGAITRPRSRRCPMSDACRRRHALAAPLGSRRPLPRRRRGSARARAAGRAAGAPRCASARTRTTCRSRTPRARASRTASPSSSARRWPAGHLLLVPAAAGLHPQHAALQAAGPGLSAATS